MFRVSRAGQLAQSGKAPLMSTSPHLLLRAEYRDWNFLNGGSDGKYVYVEARKPRLREAGYAKFAAELTSKGWDAKVNLSRDGRRWISIRCLITTQPTYVADGLYVRDIGGACAIPTQAKN